MATITWLDKIDGFDLGNPQKNVNAADMNQIKTTVNTNAELLTTMFVENEVPSGAVNSSNVTFGLANTPVAGSVKLYLNGIRLKGSGVDYSISVATITMGTAPETGDILLADYRK